MSVQTLLMDLHQTFLPSVVLAAVHHDVRVRAFRAPQSSLAQVAVFLMPDGKGWTWIGGDWMRSRWNVGDGTVNGLAGDTFGAFAYHLSRASMDEHGGRGVLQCLADLGRIRQADVQPLFDLAEGAFREADDNSTGEWLRRRAKEGKHGLDEIREFIAKEQPRIRWFELAKRLLEEND